MPRPTFKSALSLCLLVSTSVMAAPKQKLRYSIGTLWNGEPTDHPDTPATVEISLNCDGDLRMVFAAQLFNSPIVPEQIFGRECPKQTYFQLWNYEVVEAFFLNDAHQYLEIEVDPHGRYIGLLLDGQRNAVYISGPQFFKTVEVHNPCYKGDTTELIPDCKKTYSITVIVPKEYLPKNVTRFNAYAIHGTKWGEASPSEEDKRYEALYPVDPKVVPNPDFHALDFFRPIDLSEIGFEGAAEPSELWRHAMGTDNRPFEFDLTKCGGNNDHNKTLQDNKIKLTREPERKAIVVEVSIKTAEAFEIPCPDLRQKGFTKNLTTESESVWINFENSEGDRLRIGLNPYGALNVTSSFKSGISEKDVADLQQELVCINAGSTWDCKFHIPWDMMPEDSKEAYYFQAIHFHVHNDGTERKREVNSVCPGFDPEIEVDWKGCYIDVRTFASKEGLKKNRFKKM